ncbi:MAG: FkbM family methyltransferase [Candidatus Hydrogenedentes bacterium]|nr:FkbM family methyltransferase [Candidatus Hydrogenedentota bacterium]
MDYLKHLIIRTPLYGALSRLRHAINFWERRKHPGLRHIHDEPAYIDTMLRRVVNESSNCVDVGSHLGSMLVQMLRLAPRGEHVAFEALPRKAQWLRRRFPEVTVHQVALSDTPGAITFYENLERSGFSGMTPHQYHDERFREHTVRGERLDNLLPEAYRADFLKIDVEGAEFKVLQGAERVLRDSRPVVLFECTYSGLSQYGIPPKAVYLFLTEQHRYDVFAVGDWVKNGTPLTQSEFVDALVYPFRAFNFLAVPRK